MNNLIPLIIVLGPTASGKSEWVYHLAKKYNGEMVSADSRQVYKYLNIGTNKDIGVWKKDKYNKPYYEVKGIKSHLIDFLDPAKSFSVYEYQKEAIKIIKDIAQRGRQPFLAGGTGFYIDAVVQNWELAPKSFDETLRRELSQKSNIELWKALEECDSETAKRVDKHNKIRLIRALEIYYLTGEKRGIKPKAGESLFNALKIGVQVPREELYEKINRRVDEMFEEGLVKEVEALRKKYDNNLSVFRSIGYRQFFSYLDGEISEEETKELIKQDTRKYARRQMTWWRRDESIKWCDDYKKAEELAKEFVNNGN